MTCLHFGSPVLQVLAKPPRIQQGGMNIAGHYRVTNPPERKSVSTPQRLSLTGCKRAQVNHATIYGRGLQIGKDVVGRQCAVFDHDLGERHHFGFVAVLVPERGVEHVTLALDSGQAGVGQKTHFS